MKKNNLDFENKILSAKSLVTPEAKGTRLKMVRNMANLSREIMCKNNRLNVNTYKGWELARYGGLPIEGAIFIANKVALEGVVCSPEWLLYEIGIGPYVIPDFKKTQKVPPLERADFSLDEDQRHTCKEIILFRTQYDDTIDFKITDDGLAPHYLPKDYVAGVKHYRDQINELLDTICIVQLKSGLTYSRLLQAGSKPNTYNLVCTNPSTTVEKTTQRDVELYCAAPIMRHYKPFKATPKDS